MRIPFIFPLHQFSRIKYRIRRRLFTHKASTCFLHFGCDSQECKWQFYDEGMMMAIARVESHDDKSFFLASLHWITLSSVAAAVRATTYLTMMEILPVAKAEILKRIQALKFHCHQGDYFMAINKQIMQLSSLHLISSPLATLSNINTMTTTTTTMIMMALGEIKYLSIMFISWSLRHYLTTIEYRHWYPRTERDGISTRVICRNGGRGKITMDDEQKK